MKRIALAAAAVVGAALLSTLLYNTMVVPRLDDWSEIPLSWWCLVYAPLALAALCAGTLLRSITEVLGTSAAVAVAVSVVGALTAEFQLAGTARSQYFEDPNWYWVVGTLFYFVFWSVVLGAIAFLRQAGRIRSIPVG